MRRKKGFTLLELIIVVIVIGILASIALPRYIKVMEKARSSEARQVLGTIRSAQIRYRATHTVYADNLEHLDVNLTALNYFNLPVLETGTEGGTCGGLTNCIARMVRNDTTYPYSAAINIDGNISFTGCSTTDPNCAFLD